MHITIVINCYVKSASTAKSCCIDRWSGSIFAKRNRLYPDPKTHIVLHRNLPDQGNLYWTIDCKRATGTYDKGLLCGLFVQCALRILSSKLALLISVYISFTKRYRYGNYRLSNEELEYFLLVLNKAHLK